MAMQKKRSAPLSGIKVVDFGHYIAGPLAGMLLADQGADVIKVRPPGSEETSQLADALYSRGQRWVTLDLKTAGDLSSAKQLIACADVVIENFRPGVMEKLGLGGTEMSAENPRLIYVSLPGFASSDQENADVRAFEGVLGGATGLFTDIHQIRSMLGVDPLYTPIPMASVYGAVHAVNAITMALIARETSGEGDVIEVPLVSAAMSAMAGLIFGAKNKPKRYLFPPAPWLVRSIIFPLVRFLVKHMGTDSQQKLLSGFSRMVPPLFDSFLCKDGRWLFIAAGEHWRFGRVTLKELGIYDTLIEEGLLDQDPHKVGMLDNNLSDSALMTSQWKARIRELMADKLSQRSAFFWEEKLGKAGVPASVQRTTLEWLNSREARDSGLVLEIEDAKHGSIKQFATQVYLQKTTDSERIPAAANYEAPNLTRLIRAWGESSASEQGSKLSPQAGLRILEGYRVLDLSTVVAAPSCTRILSEYGADVIKVEAPNPYLGPRYPTWFALEVSQGKRSILVDLTSDEGIQVLWRLIESADVLVQNFRKGVAEKLGIGYEQVKARHPRLIYCHITSYYGMKDHSWADRPGYDPVLQSITGIMRRYGGEGKPELHGLASCVDYLTGFSAAYAIALALYRKKASGSDQGELVRTTLAQGAQLVQAPFMIESLGKKPGDEPRGQEALGEHALNRIYKAKNGWLFLAGNRNETSLLEQVCFVDELPSEKVDDQRLIDKLESVISKQNVSFAVDALREAGFGCHSVDRIDEIRKKHLKLVQAVDVESFKPDSESIVVARVDHQELGYIDIVPPLHARFKNSPSLRLGKPAPKVGQNAVGILKEHGYSAQEIADLLSKEWVSESLHADYLPG
ncbi:MAG: CoA transferase [Pseudomonadales bacterium]|nr:CoA transferase [Pseudomonadales bacterium]